ncbi:BtrH N-terminal domain-containing protein [Bacillus mycoides]|uniref:Butirosin biosynthesis protein H N-terminal domain-containing protein n=1 Tax=Bacillus thuringiensis serovar navarrensis TaxID=339658 RepID=A0A243ALE3_BACTU|nr:MULTISPECIES: BtrH N-terminal domain-containing protein [Bacillus]MBK5360438.1 hypothetical protein [Bacillus sp. TH44]MBE7105793.1 hypothetical protein [Bacillus cereus]MBE7122139.1 hypothetical protein [Bacillus cereus]MBK5345623.1 hypothetical protein [Bacillus sp. TH45]MBK5367333.1 hypothetical protein [Bacillus sp. TH50]
MNKSKLFTHPYHNCLTMTVTGVIHEEVEIEGLWFLSQLYTIKRPDNSVRFIPRMSFFNEEISEFSNLVPEHKTFSNFNDYRESLDSTLDKGIQVIAPVDTFFLPYSSRYQVQHNFHWMEIWKKEESNYKLIDHYYHFVGDLSEEDLQKAVEGSKELLQPSSYQYYSLSTKNYKSFAKQSYQKSININLTSLLSTDQVGLPVSYKIFDESYIFSQGLDVFKDIYHKLNSINQDMDEELRQATLEELYEDFNELGNSRYVFGEFLEKYDTSKETTTLVQILTDLAQEYKICANLALRNVVRNDHFSQKVFDRVSQLKEKEEQYIKQLIKLSSSIN